jgi:ADP-heptose:LPS heptosyltransferase
MPISVDTMRRIDRLAGVPLCMFLSPLVRFSDWMSGAPTRGPKRVLFVELSEMGSAILADPAMRQTIAHGSEIYFLIFSSNRPSLDLLGTVPPANVFTIESSSFWRLSRDTLRFLVWARRQQIDTVIDLELFSRFTALLTGISGASRRVGYHRFYSEGLWRGSMLTHCVQYNPHIHISRNFASLVHAAFSKDPEVPFSKVAIHDQATLLATADVKEAQIEAMASRVEAFARRAEIDYQPRKDPLFLVNVNASELLVQRRWPQGQFATLLERLEQAWPRALVLLTGAASETHYVGEVYRAAKVSRTLNFCGEVQFQELPSLYRLAGLMVTNDSGPAHFAAVTQLKTVVLFGPETPLLYSPLNPQSVALTARLACSPCVSAGNHRKTPCLDNVCMQRITVEQVFEAVASLYGGQEISAAAHSRRPGSV